MSPAPAAPESTARRVAAQRATGMVMLGSTLALVVIAAVTWAGFVPAADGIREWATAGIGVAALFDGAIGIYFLWASSQP